MFGQGVQVCVAGRVVSLAGNAEHTGDRREENEIVQIQIEGEFVQVPGAFGLHAQHPVELGGGECVDDGVVEGARRVDYRGQRDRVG